MKIGVAKNKKKVFINFYNKNIEIHPIWLRERVNNTKLLDQNNGQRLYDPSALNKRLKITSALIKKKLLNITFSDGIVSEYRIKDLVDEINKNYSKKNVFLWDGKIKNKPIFKYKEKMFEKRDGLDFLENFYKYGFAIAKKTPTKKNYIIKFAKLIGFIRPTNFGMLFNVKSVRKAIDLAYTSNELSAHTDNPYRKPIPGIQLLHCLKNESIGGHSTLTDGFAVSDYLRNKYQDIFKILTSIKIRFTYKDKNTHLENWGETIELDDSGKVKKVRLSPRIDYVPILNKNKLEQFYKARAFFIRLCNSKKFMIEFKLTPGDMLVMDNYRTLHGRSSFNMNIGERHLQGCYIDHDSAESKMSYIKNKLK